MEILTKAEYDEKVEQISSQVFDPLGDCSDYSHEILDMVLNDDDDDTEMAREDMDNRAKNKAEDVFAVGEWSDKGAMFYGAVVEHGGNHHPPESGEVTTERVVKFMAKHVFYRDVKRDAFKRARTAVGDEHRQ